MPNALPACLKLFRFPLVFTAMADSMTGAWLASTSTARPAGSSPLYLALASAGLYCFGMAMNDIADRDRDRGTHPNRVLPSGRLTVRQALAISLIVLALSGAAVLAAPAPAVYQRAIVWILIVGAILAYDFFLKFPPVMGLVRALNVILGAITVCPITHLQHLDELWGLLFLGLPGFVYVTALTFVSTLEEGKVSRVLLWGGVAFMILAVFIPPGTLTLFGARPAGAGGWAVAVLLSSWIAWRASGARDRKGVMLLVRDGVAGIIFLNAGFLLSGGALREGLGIAALLLPAAVSVAWFKRLP